MNRHTSGPWERRIDDDGDMWVIANEGHHYHIANMEGSCSECHANANLMAAAPELLAACKEAFVALLMLDIRFQHTDTIDNLGAVIAKAEGEQP